MSERDIIFQDQYLSIRYKYFEFEPIFEKTNLKNVVRIDFLRSSKKQSIVTRYFIEDEIKRFFDIKKPQKEFLFIDFGSCSYKILKIKKVKSKIEPLRLCSHLHKVGLNKSLIFWSFVLNPNLNKCHSKCDS